MTSRIPIRMDDRWVILGATGSGKTTFVKRLLWAYARATQGQLPIYIFDTKGFSASVRGKDDFKEFYQKGVGKLVRGNVVPSIFLPQKQDPFLVWQPEEDIPDMYDDFLHDIYKAGMPGVVFFDELSSLDPKGNGKNLPRHFGILQKQGRGLDLATISITQSPIYIDHNLLRQTSHMLKFRLNVDEGEQDYDTKKLAVKMGRGALAEPADDHGFFYRNVTAPTKKNPMQYYSDYKEFFGDE